MRRMYSFEQLTEIADSEVKRLIESGTIENAKPIYWHGIDLYSDTNSFQFHILNNSPAQFDTIDKIKAWAESIEGQVNVSGNGVIVVNGVARQCNVIFKRTDNVYSLVLTGTNGYEIVEDVNLNELFTGIGDSYNKVN